MLSVRLAASPRRKCTQRAKPNSLTTTSTSNPAGTSQRSRSSRRLKWSRVSGALLGAAGAGAAGNSRFCIRLFNPNRTQPTRYNNHHILVIFVLFSGILVVMLLALIHSPLVGPLTWTRVAAVLAARGAAVALPELRDDPASALPFWQQHAESVAQALAGSAE